MASSAARLLELFQGRTSEFAFGRPETDDRGKNKIAYRPSGHPITLDDLQAHMDGTGPIVGIYVLREDSHCKFASFDIDKQDLLAAEKLRRVAVDLGFPDDAMMIVDSGNKGYHLHFFFAEWIPGRQARELLKAICRAAAIPEKELELFPKQPELGQHSAYGNLIKLPLVLHPVSGRRSVIVGPRRVVPAPLTAIELVAGASVAPGGSMSPISPPLAAAGLSGPAGGFSEGGRNTHLTSWGGKLRRDGASEGEIADALLALNQTLCSPPLPEREVRVIAQSVARYPVGEGDMRLSPPPSASYVPAVVAEGEVAGVRMVGNLAKLYNLDTYEADMEHAGIQWVIDQWLVRGQLHLTVGQEKLGKSTQAWRRVEAISRDLPYLNLAVHPGRVLVMTEMSPGTVRTLLDEDDIVIDHSQVDTMFLDEYEPRARLAALGAALNSYPYTYCMLDPLDECLGLDADGVWNPSTVANGMHALRDLMRTGAAIEGLFHFNKSGKVANSYKFTSSVDHIYELIGPSPAEVTIKYRGRTRAIPPVRKLTGNGSQGYVLSVLEGMPVGRPPRTQQLILAWLMGQETGATSAEIAKALDLPYDAAKKAVRRMVEAWTIVRSEAGIYTPTLSSLPYSKHGDIKGAYIEVQEIRPSPSSEDPKSMGTDMGTNGQLEFVPTTQDDTCPGCGQTDYMPTQRGDFMARVCLACGSIYAKSGEQSKEPVIA
jgi:hypothetical protein